MFRSLSSLFFLFSLSTASLLHLALAARGIHSDHCDPTSLPPPQTLRSDQTTVLINGFSESRIPLLHSIAAVYSASPSVASVIVLWGNTSTPARTLENLSGNLSSFSAPITVSLQASASLNLRFLPRRSILTRSVLVCDDDVEIDAKSIDFAFKVWFDNRDKLIGFFARSHEIDLSSRRWIYTVHPNRYSILLTKFMIMKTDYLYKYTCGGGKSMAEARKIVDRTRNCEDILINFVVAEEANSGPILVGAERARDWGDARNEEEEERGEDDADGLGALGETKRKKRVREVGLSSRGQDHRKRRGECITEFHRVLGKMPLRYSHGKVVDSVGEQGLCKKGGKLVYCDQSIS